MKQTVTPAPPLASINEDLALSIVHGCAASTFDIVQQAAGDTGKLTPGRFWYCRGQQPSPQQQGEQLTALAAFLLAHDGLVPGEALYIHTSAHVARRKIIAFSDLPLCERLAFQVFAATLPPLVREARSAAAKTAARLPAGPPPPDDGVWQRLDGLGTRPRKSFNDQPVLSYSDSHKKEAAE